MLIYNLKKQRGEPLYELLYVAIKNDILSGRLKAGDRLPSKREMAEENRISLTTVVNAYQQLMMEGYIFSYEKRGYFVANISSMAAAESPVQSCTGRALISCVSPNKRQIGILY